GVDQRPRVFKCRHVMLLDCFVRVRKRELEKLTTEVMQLKEFLPKVLNRNLVETLHKAQKEHLVQEKEKLQQECRHLQSRLEAAQSECQKEREEKLLLRHQLWQSGAELQQQASFCSGLGSAACGLLWSCSANEDAVGKLRSFVAVAAQTLESFVRSLDEDAKTQTEDQDSEEHQFVLALAGILTNIAAVPCGRDFLASSAHVLLDTLMKLLELMKPGVFPKLKVLMLMTLYNVSISVKGLKYVIKNPGLLTLIWTLLDGKDPETDFKVLENDTKAKCFTRKCSVQSQFDGTEACFCPSSLENEIIQPKY
uniref:Heat shock transcription factor 2 binding protein n=1 Tax=Sphaeramia orbicularis TaxID=375764 RepID=A0A673A329_9TELE